ncbi:MAG: transaldolase / glucose-6-phosphate isomerase [Actinomycetota bacterium]|nr:transaldolase / glucose-6-phosphate isomerase [Actinomycetota bacterium]
MTSLQHFEEQKSLGQLASAVRRRLKEFDADDIVSRIWSHDHTVWKPDPTEIANRLGWLTLPADLRGRIPGLQAFARQVAADGFTRAVLLGMGGSSLAPEMFARTYGTAAGALELTVLDTTHPATIARVEASLDLDHTLFIVASKSGTTLETLSHFEHFYARTGGRGSSFIAITDPGTPLEELAGSKGFRRVFQNPPDLGGRYSALSLFGLVPAALIGADLEDLLFSAQEMADGCKAVPAFENPGAWLGATMGEAWLAGQDKLTFVLPASVESFGDWVEQLVAESTGKEGKGIVPVAGEDIGPPEVYGEDRLFVSLGDYPGLAPLRAAGHPVVTLEFGGPKTLGAEIFRFEFATAVAGHVMGINAFDQPNVEEAKQATRAILASLGEGGTLEEPDPGDAAGLLQGVAPGDYIAIQAYLDRTPETAAALQLDRLALRDRHRVATTVGFGPRFLHSTGQLHKGGPTSGVFLQVTDTGRDIDLPIPGKPYTFGTLMDAQALGDLQALRARRRRVARVTFEELEQLARSSPGTR